MCCHLHLGICRAALQLPWSDIVGDVGCHLHLRRPSRRSEGKIAEAGGLAEVSEESQERDKQDEQEEAEWNEGAGGRKKSSIPNLPDGQNYVCPILAKTIIAADTTQSPSFHGMTKTDLLLNASIRLCLGVR